MLLFWQKKKMKLMKNYGWQCKMEWITTHICWFWIAINLEFYQLNLWEAFSTVNHKMQLNHSQSVIRADAGITSNCCSRFIVLNPAFPVYLGLVFFLPSLILTKTAFRNSPLKARKDLAVLFQEQPRTVLWVCLCVRSVLYGVFQKEKSYFG